VAVTAQAPASPSPPKKRGAQARRRPNGLLYTWGSVFVGLLLWELWGDFVVHNSLFLATPLQSIVAMGKLWGAGTLQNDILVSFEEFIVGFLIASVAGIVIGLFTATSERVSLILTPWISGLYATPIIAVAPLLILWFGVGIWSKIAVVISLVIFPMIISTDAGIRHTDQQLVEAARSFGATQRQIFTMVCLPSAMPLILAGLRLGVGRGLIGVVVGELAGSRAGLGYMINEASQVFNMPQLFAGVIVLAAAGILFTNGFARAEKVLVPWKND
jgi:NitT/TauT family transport system permease protein